MYLQHCRHSSPCVYLCTWAEAGMSNSWLTLAVEQRAQPRSSPAPPPAPTAWMRPSRAALPGRVRGHRRGRESGGTYLGSPRKGRVCRQLTGASSRDCVGKRREDDGSPQLTVVQRCRSRRSISPSRTRALCWQSPRSLHSLSPRTRCE